MEKTALNMLINYCKYESRNDLKRYYESLGVLSTIEVLSSKKLKLSTEEAKTIICQKEHDYLNLNGTLNNTSLTKKVSDNGDLINFLQNYRGGYFARAKNVWKGKLRKSNFDIIYSFYPDLAYEPDSLSINGAIIFLGYKKSVWDSIFLLSIDLQVKPNENGSGYVLVVNIFDEHLFSEVESYPKLTPNYEEVSNLDTSVQLTYELTPLNFADLVEHALYNYPTILEEKLYKSYSLTDSLERLENIKQKK